MPSLFSKSPRGRRLGHLQMISLIGQWQWDTKETENSEEFKLVLLKNFFSNSCIETPCFSEEKNVSLHFDAVWMQPRICCIIWRSKFQSPFYSSAAPAILPGHQTFTWAWQGTFPPVHLAAWLTLAPHPILLSHSWLSGHCVQKHFIWHRRHGMKGPSCFHFSLGHTDTSIHCQCHSVL